MSPVGNATLSEPVDHQERWLTAPDGLKLYWRDYGDPLAKGIPLLCLTGLTRNSKDFHDLARRLAPTRRVITLDYRGRGRSAYDPEWRNYSPEVYLRDIQALVAAANLHPLVVCGTSLGGLLGTALAVAMPTVLAGVVLNDTGPELDARGLDRIVTYLADFKAEPDFSAAATFLKGRLPDLGYETEAQWHGLAEKTYRIDENGQLRPDWDQAIIRPLRQQRRELPDLWPLFKALRSVPVLAVRGSKSDVLSADSLERMAQAKPDLQRLTIEGVGHAPSLDEPEARGAIDDFLAVCDRARSRVRIEQAKEHEAREIPCPTVS